ncbi:MAG TPA: hypothetical protein VHQ87_08065, partial [Rhizobacter sp.]|nr:hypothetical protein [Rhizobacter sp.]
RKTDFDPTHLLDDWRPLEPARPLVAPPELDLSGLRTETDQRPEPRLDAERLARLKKRGFQMDDVEDIEAPEIAMPLVDAPPTLDLAGIDEALSAAAGLAQPQQHPTPGPPQIESLARDQPGDPRLLRHWQPRAWIGVRRKLSGASTELLKSADGQPIIESHPPQWLLAVWPPQGLDVPLLGRWPDRALLVGAQQSQAADRLVLQQAVPEQAPLWIGELDADWPLIAELVLLHDAALKPFQLEALRALIEEERLARFARLNNAYEPGGGSGAQRRPQ